MSEQFCFCESRCCLRAILHNRYFDVKRGETKHFTATYRPSCRSSLSLKERERERERDVIRNHFSQSIFRQKKAVDGGTDRGTDGQQSAKEAEKIGLTSERGSRRRCGPDFGERLRDLLQSKLRKLPSTVNGAPWRAAKCFRSSLTSQGSRKREGGEGQSKDFCREAERRGEEGLL